MVGRTCGVTQLVSFKVAWVVRPGEQISEREPTGYSVGKLEIQIIH